MDEAVAPQPAPRRRIPRRRAMVATLIMLGFLTLALLYHDGVLGAQSVGDVVDHGLPYRVRGTVSDVETDAFVLADGSDSLVVFWDLTRPERGTTYVVTGIYNETAQGLDGQSVERVWMPWPGIEPGTFGL